jgi:His/Glu/Gln/Arg/opine family amino acid ABC transporter permease subunit
VSLRFDLVLESAGWLAQGLAMTYFVALVSIVVGLALGLVFATARSSSLLILRAPAIVYISFFRGLPLIAFLIWLYFGVTVAFNLQLSALSAGIACLSIQASAYLAEIYRAGLQAIPQTQTQAALSLGLTPWQAFRTVRFPQALRVIFPAIGNEFIGLIKGSALVSVLGVFELMRSTQQRVLFYQLPLEFYTTAALLYIISGVGIGRLFLIIERRMQT